MVNMINIYQIIIKHVNPIIIFFLKVPVELGFGNTLTLNVPTQTRSELNNIFTSFLLLESFKCS